MLLSNSFAILSRLQPSITLSLAMLGAIGLGGCVTTGPADSTSNQTPAPNESVAQASENANANDVPPALQAYLSQLTGDKQSSADASPNSQTNPRQVQWEGGRAQRPQPQTPAPKSAMAMASTPAPAAAQQPQVQTEPVAQSPQRTGPIVVIDPPADAQASALNASMETAATISEQTPPLAIDTFKLCRQVSGFGIYEPFASYSFIAGKAQRAIVYVEVSNFQPAPAADGYLETRLTQSVTLYHKADGLAVWQQQPARVLDRSRNHRRDFFVVQMIELPATLSVGEYRLKVSITDENAGTIAQQNLAVQILADPALAQPAAEATAATAETTKSDATSQQMKEVAAAARALLQQ